MRSGAAERPCRSRPRRRPGGRPGGVPWGYAHRTASAWAAEEVPMWMPLRLVNRPSLVRGRSTHRSRIWTTARGRLPAREGAPRPGQELARVFASHPDSERESTRMISSDGGQLLGHRDDLAKRSNITEVPMRTRGRQGGDCSRLTIDSSSAEDGRGGRPARDRPARAPRRPRAPGGDAGRIDRTVDQPEHRQHHAERDLVVADSMTRPKMFIVVLAWLAGFRGWQSRAGGR